MEVSAVVVIILMWLVAYTAMGATCGFADPSDLCDLYDISLDSLVFTMLIIIGTVILVAFGAKFANDKWDKKIDMVSAFAISFVIFWVIYGFIARNFLVDFLYG
jgi:hypothetical protein